MRMGDEGGKRGGECKENEETLSKKVKGVQGESGKREKKGGGSEWRMREEEEKGEGSARRIKEGGERR